MIMIGTYPTQVLQALRWLIEKAMHVFLHQLEVVHPPMGDFDQCRSGLENLERLSILVLLRRCHIRLSGPS